MNSWYFYWICKFVLFILIEIEAESIKNQPEELKANRLFFRVLWFDKNKYMAVSTSLGFAVWLYRVVVTLIRIAYHFCIAIYRHAISSIFNTLDIVSTILIIIGISFWIQIATIDTFVIDSKGMSPEAFYTIESSISLLSKYEIIISIAILLMCWNIMRYFSFSSKLSMFYEVINNALFDVIFFVIMQAIIMWGYALMGFMLFGISDEGFSTFKDSCLTLFLMIIGNKSALEISTPDTITLYLFEISFTLINVLLLNILVAIYTSHYFQFYLEHDITGVNSFYLFLKILGGKHKNVCISYFY